MIRLRLLVPGKESEELLLGDPIIVIGRDPSNHIIIDDSQASRYHCQIERDEEGWKVVDNASANGTAVNGQPINFRRLTTGDKINIGQTAIEILEVAAGRGSRRARPVTSADDEPTGERRSRRRVSSRSQNSVQVTAWTMAIVCIVIVMGLIGSSQMKKQLHGNTVRAARLALDEDDFDKAEALLGSVPSGSSHHTEALGLLQEVRRERAAFQKQVLETQAGRVYMRLTEFARLPNENRATMQERLDRFLRDFATTSYADRARALVETMPLEARGGSVAPRWEEPDTPKRKTPLEQLNERVDRYITSQQFGSAIEELRDFWNDNTGAAADAANARIEKVREEADKAWSDIRFAATELAKKGDKERALSLLWDAEGFGIESIREAAHKMAEEIGK